MSMHRTLNPSSDSAPARLMAVVVLPTPPFWLAIAISFVTGASPLVTSRGVVWRAGRTAGGMAPCYSTRREPRQALYPQMQRLVHHFCGYLERQMALPEGQRLSSRRAFADCLCT